MTDTMLRLVQLYISGLIASSAVCDVNHYNLTARVEGEVEQSEVKGGGSKFFDVVHCYCI